MQFSIFLAIKFIAFGYPSDLHTFLVKVYAVQFLEELCHLITAAYEFF